MGDYEIWYGQTQKDSVGVYVLKFSDMLMVQNFEFISDVLKEVEIIQRNNSLNCMIIIYKSCQLLCVDLLP